jgi:hypothetical protein
MQMTRRLDERSARLLAVITPMQGRDRLRKNFATSLKRTRRYGIRFDEQRTMALYEGEHITEILEWNRFAQSQLVLNLCGKKYFFRQVSSNWQNSYLGISRMIHSLVIRTGIGSYERTRSCSQTCHVRVVVLDATSSLGRALETLVLSFIF